MFHVISFLCADFLQHLELSESTRKNLQTFLFIVIFPKTKCSHVHGLLRFQIYLHLKHDSRLIPPLSACLILSAVRLVKGEEKDTGLRQSLCIFPRGASFGWARGLCHCLYRSAPKERGRKVPNWEPVQDHRKENQRDRKTLAFFYPLHF